MFDKIKADARRIRYSKNKQRTRREVVEKYTRDELLELMDAASNIYNITNSAPTTALRPRWVIELNKLRNMKLQMIYKDLYKGA